jgi:hypothetical protein
MTGSILELLNGQAGMNGVAAARDTDELVAFELLTVDEGGWPHVAWLGPAEVLPIDNDSLALAVWPGSQTRQNLQAGRCVLQVVVDGLIHRIRLQVVGLGPVAGGDGSLEGFLGTAAEIITDDVAYADVLSGLRYKLLDSAKVLQRWEMQVTNLTEVVARHKRSSSSR